MAKRKKNEESRWVRTGGFVGDASMEEGQRFSEDGCGVPPDTSIKHCKADPNDGISLGKRKGADRG